MSILPIRLYGDRVLRQKAGPVEEVGEEERRLAADMIETMRAAEGVGLAANQVGDLRRILVVDYQPVSGEDLAEAFINPEILSREGTMSLEEGCLSIPDVREEIERARKVEVTWLDTSGERHTETFEDYLAAVLQHEIDHLDGILIVDRVSAIRRNLLKGTLKRIARQA